MKKMKKLLSVLLTLVMVLAMAAPGFAAEGDPVGTGENGEITVNKAVDGLEYKAYRILDAVFNSDKSSVAYTVSTKWADFLDAAGVSDYLELIPNTTNVRWKDGADAAGLSTLALKYAKDNSIAADGTVEAANGVAAFGALDFGYYLVDAGAGTLCELSTNKPNVVITEKNGAPEVDKKIGAGENKVSSNTASVGDYIPYEVVITAKPGATGYVLHDQMSEGLTFVKSYTVTEGEQQVTRQLTVKKGDDIVAEEGNYTVANKANDNGFDLTFTDGFMTTLRDELAAMTTEPKEIKITINYYARVNANAVVAGTGNTNDARLSYGNEHITQPTDESKTTTYTYKVEVQKYTATFTGEVENADSQTPLAGAKFKLSTENSVDGAPIKVTAQTGAGVTVPTYKVIEDQTAAGTTEISTSTDDGANGTFVIEGLAAGTYYLIETEAPTGYNKLDAPVAITIGEDGVVTGVNQAGLFQVLNKAGTLLPSTGGIGTTIFYAAGIILMAGAVFFVVRRKRA